MPASTQISGVHHLAEEILERVMGDRVSLISAPPARPLEAVHIY